MSKAKTIAIFNQKGGVGKTTTSINFSIELAMRGKKVLLIDADQQEHMARSLGIEKKDIKATLYTILTSEIYNKPYKKDLSGAIIPTEVNVDILPGSVDMCEIDEQIYSIAPMDSPAVKFLKDYLEDNDNLRETIDTAGGAQYMAGFSRVVDTYNKAEDMFYERMQELDLLLRKQDGKRILKKILSRISGNYDYIVIDCPPGLSAITKNVLVASDRVIVPAIPDPYSVTGIVNLVSTVKAIKKSQNPTLEFSGLLYTMVEKNRSAITEVMGQSEDVVTRFMYIYDSVIPRSTAVNQALLSGMPLVKYQKNNGTRLGYSAFCDEFLDREDI